MGCDLEFITWNLIMSYWKMLVSIHTLLAKGKRIKKIKAYRQLVLLDFTVTSFTSVAYQRHSL